MNQNQICKTQLTYITALLSDMKNLITRVIASFIEYELMTNEKLFSNDQIAHRMLMIIAQ